MSVLCWRKPGDICVSNFCLILTKLLKGLLYLDGFPQGHPINRETKTSGLVFLPLRDRRDESLPDAHRRLVRASPFRLSSVIELCNNSTSVRSNIDVVELETRLQNTTETTDFRNRASKCRWTFASERRPNRF